MEKVYDLAKYKKKKQKQKIANKIQKYNFAISFFVLFTIGIVLWWLISFTAVMIYSVTIILVSLIYSKKRNKAIKKHIERIQFKKPQ